MSESHDGSSGYDTALMGFDVCPNVKSRYSLYPFVLINGYKEHIGTRGVSFETYEECLAAGDRWMSLDRETQLEMLTKPDYTKFV